jgi:hypothetical protein
VDGDGCYRDLQSRSPGAGSLLRSEQCDAVARRKMYVTASCEKTSRSPLKTRLSASSWKMGYNEPRMMPMPLLQEPITKEQFERELRALPPREADSRREFWTLCEALQAMEDTKCPPPDWFIESFNKVLEYASEKRAEPWRELRHRLLEHMGEFQREPRVTRQRQKRFTY